MQNIQVVIDAVFNLVLFSFIPFVWWVFFHRKKEKFFSWIGFIKPDVKHKRVFIILFVSFMAISAGSNFIPAIFDRSISGTGQLQGTGISALFQALLFGMVQTGAAEEILFRGFLAKRLIKWLGFSIGNIAQAALFGLLHIAFLYLAATDANIFQGLMLFIIPFSGGWLFGYINEKQSGGSIVPSWLMHGIGNVIAAVISMYFFR